MLNQNHLSFQGEKEIKKILSPLTKRADIHYFCYGVNFADKSGFTLSTSARYYETWFENKFPMVGFHLKSGWYAWDTILPQKQIDIGAELDIGKGVLYVNHHEGKTECFGFAAPSENKDVMTFYLNNQNLLKKFTHHFKQSAEPLIEMAKEQIVVPATEMVLENKTVQSLSQSDLFEELGSIRKVLSAREWQCYRLLLKGYSIADIGLKLTITKPTVAVYISRIKHKLQCFNKREMIQKAVEESLVEYYIE